MKVVTPKQMNEIDNISITQIGIPGIVLMENAAIKVVDEIKKDLKVIKGKSIMIFAGKGNNGGDAFAVARHLFNMGAELKVYVLAKKESVIGDAGINLRIIENMGIEIQELVDKSMINSMAHEMDRADLILDGIFGTGLKGEVTGFVKDIVVLINSSDKPVLSIDIPSGVCGMTGRVLGTCINAYKTVTFALPKLGLILHPGSEFVGNMIIADIGIPSDVIAKMDIGVHLIEDDYFSKLLPKRASDSNKGDYGRVLIVSGSLGMTGAGVLSAGAALRVGAGLVYLGVPSSLVSTYDSALAEAVTIPLNDENKGVLSEKCIDKLIESLDRMSVVAIGPGMTSGDGVYHVVRNVVSNCKVPLVMDADALNVLSKDMSILSELKVDAVMTPHPGEMSRLTGLSIKEIQGNRLHVAKEYACKWNVTIVLKGSKTIVALPDGNTFINCTGNSGMATAGAGDVLTGIIAGLIGQGLSVSDAAVAGVYLHGLAGDRVAEQKGEHGLVAGDLVKELPYAIKTIKNKE